VIIIWYPPEHGDGSDCENKWPESMPEFRGETMKFYDVRSQSFDSDIDMP